MHRPFAAAIVALLLVCGFTLAISSPADMPPGVTPVAMCDESEPGERVDFCGRVLDENGNPLRNAAVIAYNTDVTGLYVPRGSPHRNPRICAVAVTDDGGWYRFTTVRPGSYPGTQDPAHIHMHIDAAVHRHTYVTFWFDDDPLVTPEARRATSNETVVVTPRRRDDGIWTFRHDVRLRGG